jgi:hypothetical protein
VYLYFDTWLSFVYMHCDCRKAPEDQKIRVAIGEFNIGMHQFII